MGSPGGLRKSPQVASEVTYMEHMCLSHLVVPFSLPTEEGCEWATRIEMVDNDEMWGWTIGAVVRRLLAAVSPEQAGY